MCRYFAFYRCNPPIFRTKQSQSEITVQVKGMKHNLAQREPNPRCGYSS